MKDKEARRTPRGEMIKGFSEVINRNSWENESNTPDFILAEYLMDCLDTYSRIHRKNERWYGRELKII